MLTLVAGAVAQQSGSQGASPPSDKPLALTQDFSRPEPGEEFPGGGATSRKSVKNANAFSHSSGNMPFRKELDFKVGNGIFRKLWVSPPASTKSSDGLGPLFNARSCQRCHLKDGRGHPPEANFPDDDATSMFLRLSVPPQTDVERALLAARKINVVPEPTYGSQLQEFAIQGHSAEGKMRIDYADVPYTFPDGEKVTLRKPRYAVDKAAYGSLHKDVMLSPRVANQMIGLGLLEAIPEKHIRALADPQDRNGDGISGRPNEVWSIAEDRPALGRFGWKAGAPSVRQQSAEAFAGDIGISTPLVRKSAGDCTDDQTDCVTAPNGDSKKDGVEAGKKFLDLVTFYSQNLAVPRRRDPANRDVLAGKKLFYNAGCAACHRPKFVTGISPGQPHLSRQIIWPYTDMLLHDMGEGLADNRPEGVADGREWRTAPLWGIGLTPTVNGHSFYLHDGRARNLTEAILWHDGEARSARDAFAALSKEDRDRLIAFVKSL
ncbi:MAG: c-type cytochrome [Hyphomicrobiaceae bacterium]|nr:c-type cytochrome [Hyphomicrobiaceae bacterium]